MQFFQYLLINIKNIIILYKKIVKIFQNRLKNVDNDDIFYKNKLKGLKMIKTLFDLFITFARIGVLTFGGGLTMLPLLKYEIVEKKGWATEDELIDYYAIGQCTPGIIAVNTATFIGYKKGKIIGGIIATLGMIFPSLVIILSIAAILSGFMDNALLQHALIGIRAVVCALLVNTVVMLGKKSIVDIFGIIVFILVIAVCFFLNVSSVIIVIISGLIGILMSMRKEKKE